MFLVDAQLPPAVALWLRDRKYPAEHVSERIGISASDGDVLVRAHHEALTIITKDEYFAFWANARRGPVSVMLIRLQSTTSANLLPWLATRWAAAWQAVLDGQRFVEVTK